MHDLASIRQQHIANDARQYAMPLLFSLEQFAAGNGDMTKAQMLIDLVYKRTRETAEGSAVTGPTRHTPLITRPADGMTVAGRAA